MSVRRTPASSSVRRHPSDAPVAASSWRADTNPGEVGRILGERWKALNEKQRAPYEAKAAADKKRYEDEKAAYNVSPPLAFPEGPR